MGFAARLGLRFPLIQAPMAGGFTTAELVAAVSNAKALGSLGAAFLGPKEIQSEMQKIKTMTDRPFNVNLFIVKPFHGKADIEPFRDRLKKYQHEFSFQIGAPSQLPTYESQIEAILSEKASVISFTFGNLEREIVKEIQKQGIYVIGTATHVEEAMALEESGVDAIVVQGKEAGGHRGTFLGDPMQALIPAFEFLEAARKAVKIPLIASGGIMEKSDVLKALHAGAAGVQMGTAFMTCFETGGPPIYKKVLMEMKERKAVLTRAFSGRWARGVENRFIREMAPYEEEIPPYPIPHFMTQPMRKAAGALENPEFLSVWAGERFSHCKRMAAQELVESLF